MAQQTPIINILTYTLPYKLANQMYKEYDARLREALFIIEQSERYSSLRDSVKTVELLLALSIFEKRVICNLQGGVKFYSMVTSNSQSDTIQIGSYKFTGEERNKVLGVIMSYKKILADYGLSEGLTNYSVTKDFLKYLVNLKSEDNNV